LKITGLLFIIAPKNSPMTFAPTPSTISRRITILGSTGSIGTQTLALLEASDEAFYVEALVARGNAELLAKQALQVKPGIAVLAEENARLGELLKGSGVAYATGSEAVLEAASRKTDWTMAAIVGIAGLAPTLRAIASTKVLALANKESLVCAGTLLLEAVAKHGTKLIPVDSEHSAILQCFEERNRAAIDRVTLTASGGPFREYSLEQMRTITPAQAVAHPNWSMGAKISVDSATLVNKGLELIEAHYLFNLAPEELEVVIHPESIIHSMVTYQDGATLAQLGLPDMATPIAVALYWPERKAIPHKPLSLTEYAALHFETPDEERFPALSLAKQVLEAGQGAQIVFNAANEVAVQEFMAGKIGFLDIAQKINSSLDRFENNKINSVEDVYSLDAKVRNAGEGRRVVCG
jgi:1-deoxy-D-xylulose-5-phosphate reductoisomerase